MPSTPCPLPLPPQSFDTWVEHCEISVSDQRSGDCVNGDALLDLVASIPSELTVQQQERAGHLLARLFCRFVSTLDRRIVSDLARGALAADHASEWLTASLRLAGLVVRASARADGVLTSPPACRTDARVAQTLSDIDRHFTDPRFGLGAAARRVALSDCRLTQLLKITTGRTFGSHLHHRRIAEARTLLHQSALSIKEIATRVGYQSTTQLDRHFKRITRSLPSAYRAVASHPAEIDTR
jgi:AraC-like DNA-binding protein